MREREGNEFERHEGVRKAGGRDASVFLVIWRLSSVASSTLHSFLLSRRSLSLPLGFILLWYYLTWGERCQIKSGYSFKQPHTRKTRALLFHSSSRSLFVRSLFYPFFLFLSLTLSVSPSPPLFYPFSFATRLSASGFSKSAAIFVSFLFISLIRLAVIYPLVFFYSHSLSCFSFSWTIFNSSLPQKPWYTPSISFDTFRASNCD